MFSHCSDSYRTVKTKETLTGAKDQSTLTFFSEELVGIEGSHPNIENGPSSALRTLPPNPRASPRSALHTSSQCLGKEPRNTRGQHWGRSRLGQQLGTACRQRAEAGWGPADRKSQGAWNPGGRGGPGTRRAGPRCRGVAGGSWVARRRHVGGQQLQPDSQPGHPYSPRSPRRRRAAPAWGLQHHPGRHALQHHPGR